MKDLVVKVKLFEELDPHLYAHVLNVSQKNRAERLRYLASLGLKAEQQSLLAGNSPAFSSNAPGSRKSGPQKSQYIVDNVSSGAMVESESAPNQGFSADLSDLFGESDQD